MRQSLKVRRKCSARRLTVTPKRWWSIRGAMVAFQIVLGASLTTAIPSALASDCNSARGEQVFAKCSVCHSLEPERYMVGPTLYALSGRRAGTVKGFNFSSALRESRIYWNEATLDSFLGKPQAFLPGNVMAFGGIRNTADRAAVICYLLGK